MCPPKFQSNEHTVNKGNLDHGQAELMLIGASYLILHVFLTVCQIQVELIVILERIDQPAHITSLFEKTESMPLPKQTCLVHNEPF